MHLPSQRLTLIRSSPYRIQQSFAAVKLVRLMFGDVLTGEPRFKGLAGLSELAMSHPIGVKCHTTPKIRKIGMPNLGELRTPAASPLTAHGISSATDTSLVLPFFSFHFTVTILPVH